MRRPHKFVAFSEKLNFKRLNIWIDQGNLSQIKNISSGKYLIDQYLGKQLKKKD